MANHIIDGDISLGEPFIDVNGDGVYDWSIDTFVVSLDPEKNQDLNHNGLYDGPDAYWSPGVPYDDLNKDGEFNLPSREHEPGEPFGDINGNGVFDDPAEGGLSGDITKCVRRDHGADSIEYYYEYRDSTFLFTSDSGREYGLPAQEDVTFSGGGQYLPLPEIRYLRTSRGLMAQVDDQYSVLVLDTGTVVEQVDRIPFYLGSDDSVSIRRSTTIDTSVFIAGIRRDSVTLVRIDRIEPYPYQLPYMEGWREEYWHEFYFIRGEGCIGSVHSFFANRLPRTYHIVSRTGTVPLPAIR